jgi:poly(A) polymerase
MIPPDHPVLADGTVSALLVALNGDGEEARIVGGAVRDAVMGRTGGDVDIATTATPETVVQRARAAGWKTVPTGIAHGTVTVVIAGRPFEVTTLRRDVATDGRHAVVTFTRDFCEDAYRRDFTLNALSLDRDGTVHDYATGLDDAAQGRICFMGNPERRIAEDYLRILRFFRFHASHGQGSPDRDGLAACAALKAGIGQLSRERVRQELFKLLVAPGALPSVMAMDAIGLWPVIMEGLAPQITAFSHVVRLESALHLPPDALLRLAALCGDRPAKALDLKLSRQEELRLSVLNQHARAFVLALPDLQRLRRLAFITDKCFVATLLLGHGRMGTDPERTRAWLDLARPVLLDPPRNPFRSVDAGRLGIGPGPRMGLVLKAALNLWLDAGLPDDKAMQMALLKQASIAHPT